MKEPLLSMIGVGALLLALTSPLQAQPGPGMGGMAGNRGWAADCSKARNPQQCEARKQAQEVCKDKARPERRACMQQHMPPADCSKARNPSHCEAGQKAREACKDLVGPTRRECMRQHMGTTSSTTPKPVRPPGAYPMQ